MPLHQDQRHAGARHRRRVGPSNDSAADPGIDDLLLATGQGDLRALAQFYDQTASLVFGLLCSVLENTELAERAAERIYVALWRSAPLFEPAAGSARSLLMSITRRELVRCVLQLSTEPSIPLRERDTA